MINLNKYKHISFDLDGTLVHAVPEYRHKIVPMVVSRLGGKVINERSVDRFWFEAGRDKIIIEEFSLAPDKFWPLFRELDTLEERKAHTWVYPDAERTLVKLKQAGKIISIITGAPAPLAKMEIDKLNRAPLDYYFSITSSGLPQKPDPQSFFHVLEKLSLPADLTLYIGNSNEDALFARNAGVDFLYLERREHEFDLKEYSIGEIHSLDELF